MVIAKYKEDVSWADAYLNKIIIDKGAGELPNLPGREAHTYLWYIVNNYENLHGDYVFCQGNPFDHVSSFDSDIKEEFFDFKPIGDWRTYSKPNGRPHHRGKGLEVAKYVNELHLPEKREYLFTAGANFMVSAKSIKKYPKTFWKQCLLFSESDEQSGYIFERLWETIFLTNVSPSGTKVVCIDMHDAVELIRNAGMDELLDKGSLEVIIRKSGVEPPGAFGQLRIYQQEMQFAEYLIFISSLRITSYIEIGIFQGGCFIFTCEYLKRFNELERAVAVDCSPPSTNMIQYHKYQDYKYIQASSLSVEFKDLIRDDHFSLGMIDGDHNHAKQDCDTFYPHCDYLAFHDIIHLPLVRVAWLSVPAKNKWEFTEQHNYLKPSMGIGLLETKHFTKVKSLLF